jgi:hypothetical protein
LFFEQPRRWQKAYALAGGSVLNVERICFEKEFTIASGQFQSGPQRLDVIGRGTAKGRADPSTLKTLLQRTYGFAQIAVHCGDPINAKRG